MISRTIRFVCVLVLLGAAIPRAMSEDLGEMLVGQALDHLNGVAQSAEVGAKTQGDALLGDTVNQIEVLIQFARIALADSLDKQVKTLSVSANQLLGRIEDMTSKLDDFTAKAYNFRDTTDVDIRELEETVPFLKTAEFYILHVQGLTHYAMESSFPMTLTGVNLGPDTSDRKTTFLLKLGDKPITAERISRSDAGIVTIVLPASAFAESFNPSAVSEVQLKIDVSISHYGGLIVRSWSTPKQYVLPLWIALVPVHAATLTLAGGLPIFGWQFARTDSFEQTGPDANCSHNCKHWYGTPWAMVRKVAGGDPPVAGFERISGVASFTCVSGPGGAFDADVRSSVTDNGATVTGYVRARTRPSVYRLVYNVDRYQQIRTDSLPSTSLSIDYGEVKTFTVPANTENLILSGTSISNESIAVVLDGKHTDPFIEIESDQINGNERNITIKAKAFTNLL